MLAARSPAPIACLAPTLASDWPFDLDGHPATIVPGYRTGAAKVNISRSRQTVSQKNANQDDIAKEANPQVHH